MEVEGKKILVIGAGNMGGTYARSLISEEIVEKDNLYILERQEHLCDRFEEAGFGNVFRSAGEFISDVQWIILAVKPQDSHLMLEQVKPYINEQQFVISIMAGVQMATIQKKLNIKKVIRAMPNLPAGIGMGMTAFTVSEDVNREGLLAAQNLLNSTGKSIYVDTEEKIDAATAISGSGPAYVFYYMDLMIEAAQDLGFTHLEAKLLVEQTFLGTVNLLHRNGSTPKEWIKRVASRGGTTEAALKVYEDVKLKDAAHKGIEAAFRRAVELSAF